MLWLRYIFYKHAAVSKRRIAHTREVMHRRQVWGTVLNAIHQVIRNDERLTVVGDSSTRISFPLVHQKPTSKEALSFSMSYLCSVAQFPMCNLRLERLSVMFAAHVPRPLLGNVRIASLYFFKSIYFGLLLWNKWIICL